MHENEAIDGVGDGTAGRSFVVKGRVSVKRDDNAFRIAKVVERPVVGQYTNQASKQLSSGLLNQLSAHGRACFLIQL